MKVIVKNKRNVWVCFCVALAIITSSFDIVGMVNIAGFNFRFSQFIVIPVIIGWLANSVSNGKVTMPVGGISLLIWTIVQLVFVFRSPDFKNALGYFLWLVFNVVIIYCVVYYLDIAYNFQWIMKVYLNSFVYIAILGLIQFALYPFKIDFFVAQSWSKTLARINGFSYEPSYYATYLLMGFVIYTYLWKQKNTEIFPMYIIKRNTFIVSLAMVLSSSRMGWLMMAVWLVMMILLQYIKFMKNGLSKNQAFFLMILVPFFIFVGVAGVSSLNNRKNLLFLLNGLGIFGTSAHSANDRIKNLKNCLEIFKNNPVLGYSLGGVDPVLARTAGIAYSTLNNGAGGSLIGELLLANGIVGLVPFLNYFRELILVKVRDNTNAVHLALVWALVMEMMILCFNQNILRPYVWWHIAILSVSHENVISERKK